MYTKEMIIEYHGDPEVIYQALKKARELDTSSRSDHYFARLKESFKGKSDRQQTEIAQKFLENQELIENTPNVIRFP